VTEMQDRPNHQTRRDCLKGVGLCAVAAILMAAPKLIAQAAAIPPEAQPPKAPAGPAQPGAIAPRPIAIVPLDSKIPGFAAEVNGGMQVFNGRAFIASNGSITAGSQTAQVTLPYRGTLRVCASTTIKLATDPSVPTGEVPGLLMALETGAIEASFATGRNSDVLLTPDFRILIGGPGAAEVKVRLGEAGDTCVDNAGANAPYVLVSSVFDAGAYRVQAGQRVMFQHGKLSEVVDQEKEPCGCPPAAKENSNDFPLAQSEGLQPILHPVPVPEGPRGEAAQSSTALVYNAADKAAATTAPAAAALAAPPAPAPVPQKKRGFLGRIGHFFGRIFGGE